MTQVSGLSPVAKAKLTTWIMERRRAGEAAPHVTFDVAREATNRRPLKIEARKDRVFLALAGTEELTPGWRFPLGGNDQGAIAKYKNLLSVWTESASDRDLIMLIRMLVAEGYLTDSENLQKIFLTSKGFQRLEDLQGANPESHQAFIAMWFDPSMDAAAAAIQEAIRDAGYEPLIISDKEHNGDINDAIISEIRRSRFVVADFTCGALTDAKGTAHGIPRGGVYFEAGFAKGLGIEVIWSCRADSMSWVHFDTNHFAHVVWSAPADLKEKLTRRIGAVVGYSPSARVAPPKQ